MLGTGVAATLPVLLLFTVPTRELLAMMLNGIEPAPGASWGFILERYPGALLDFVRAEGGFVRGGAWYSFAYLGAGTVLLFVLGRGDRRSDSTLLLQAGAVAGLVYVLALPIFSAFRLELVCVPAAAFGLALGAERLAESLGARFARVRIRPKSRARSAGLA